MGKSGGKGGSLVLLLLLLAILCGAGGWNYHRNLEIEKQEEGARPFAGYSDAALAQLAAAYEDELQQLERRFGGLRGSRAGVRDTALIGDAIEEFERVQKHGKAVREATAQLAEREARLRDIRGEQQYREASRNGLALHLKRLTGIAI